MPRLLVPVPLGVIRELRVLRRVRVSPLFDEDRVGVQAAVQPCAVGHTDVDDAVAVDGGVKTGGVVDELPLAEGALKRIGRLGAPVWPRQSLSRAAGECKKRANAEAPEATCRETRPHT